MEINEILKNVIMENEKAILTESDNYMNEEEHDSLSDCDRVEIALEMLYGVENNYPGLAGTIIRLQELCGSMKEDEGEEEYEDMEDDEMDDDMYEDEDDEMEGPDTMMMVPNPSLQNFTLSLKR